MNQRQRCHDRQPDEMARIKLHLYCSGIRLLILLGSHDLFASLQVTFKVGQRVLKVVHKSRFAHLVVPLDILAPLEKLIIIENN